MKRKQLGRIDLSNTDKPKVNFNSLGAFHDNLREYKHDEQVWIEVSSYKRKRNPQQNSLFHVFCQEIATETGQDLDAVKSTVKLLYARKPLLDKNGEEQFNTVTGELLEYVQDTSDMDTAEMANLITKTQMFALDYFGIILESINEQVALKFKE